MPLLGNLSSKPEDIGADGQWKISFSMAVGLHLLVLCLTLLPSSFFRNRAEIPEVVTINLFNAEELKSPKPVAKKSPPKRAKVEEVAPKKSLPPPVVKKEISVAPPDPAPVVVAPVAVTPAKVISLKPRVMKKKVVKPEEPKEKVFDETLRNVVDRIRAKKQQEMELAKAKDNLARLRESLHVAPAPVDSSLPESEPQAAAPEESDASSATDIGSYERMEKALSRYYLAISRRIHEHWVLPEMQKWDDSLESIFVVVIRRDGTVIRSFFEKKSANPYFNQFVEKTIQEAQPMPQFPADLKESTLELGLKFHPSGMM